MINYFSEKTARIPAFNNQMDFDLNQKQNIL